MPQTSPVTLMNSELHEFQAKDGTIFSVYIALPLSYNPSRSDGYPVLFMTDANLGFTRTSEIHRWLQNTNQIEPMILVGIDIPFSDLRNVQAEMTKNREWLFTPSSNSEREESLSQQANLEIRSGGASNFLSVIKDELSPWLDEKFNTSDESGIASYSFGGLFATYVLFNHPDSFDYYLIGSPGLWVWEEEVFQSELLKSQSLTDISAKVYLSVAADEPAGRVASLLRIADTLSKRGYPSLTMKYELHRDENHMTANPLTMTRGFKYLFSKD